MKNKTPNIKLLYNRVLIKPDTTDKISAGGLILIDHGPQPPSTSGTIMVTGPGTKDYNMETKVGDHVRYGQHSGAELILDDGCTYLIMRETEISMIMHRSK